MVWRSRFLSRLLFLGGALLLAKGSFSVYPFLFPESQAAEVSAAIDATPVGSRFKPGAALFDLSLPRQDARFTVVEGTTNAALRKGPGHLEGSPLPGAPGNSVIAGHRDTHFRVLKDVLIGDEIRVDWENEAFTYRIFDVRIVSPRDTQVLRAQTGQTITLITCYPFYFLGPAPMRYVVHARLASR